VTSGDVRVLLADDSRTARALLRELCTSTPGVTVVGEAGDGQAAIEQVRSLRPSLVVMDVEMPVLDGIEATRRIMRETPTPILVVTAHHDARDVALSLRAVEAGALTVAPKPTGPDAPSFRADADRFVRLVKALSGVRPVRRHYGARGAVPPAQTAPAAAPLTAPRLATAPASRPKTQAEAREPAAPLSVPVYAIGIGASTGGPAAVHQLLGLLPARLPVPVLVVQHIADGFAPGLARWLDAATPLDVRVAEDGDELRPSTVYVAPDGCHLLARPCGRATLQHSAPVAGFRPSASVLFRSLAQTYGAGALGVVLTGMGNDGLDGARALHAVGAPVLAQDADSSVVFGMPRAVTEAGLTTFTGTVEQLASRVSWAASKEQGRKGQP
jgi:two-component system chemotaxis response regulator CheB